MAEGIARGQLGAPRHSRGCIGRDWQPEIGLACARVRMSIFPAGLGGSLLSRGLHHQCIGCHGPEPAQASNKKGIMYVDLLLCPMRFGAGAGR